MQTSAFNRGGRHLKEPFPSIILRIGHSIRQNQNQIQILHQSQKYKNVSGWESEAYSVMGCVTDDSGTDFHVWNHIWNLSQPPLPPSIPYFRQKILRHLEISYFRQKHIEKCKNLTLQTGKYREI